MARQAQLGAFLPAERSIVPSSFLQRCQRVSARQLPGGGGQARQGLAYLSQMWRSYGKIVSEKGSKLSKHLAKLWRSLVNTPTPLAILVGCAFGGPRNSAKASPSPGEFLVALIAGSRCASPTSPGHTANCCSARSLPARDAGHAERHRRTLTRPRLPFYGLHGSGRGGAASHSLCNVLCSSALTRW